MKINSLYLLFFILLLSCSGIRLVDYPSQSLRQSYAFVFSLNETDPSGIPENTKVNQTTIPSQTTSLIPKQSQVQPLGDLPIV